MNDLTKCEITVGLNCHREGELLPITFNSIRKALEFLDLNKITWELICIADKSDEITINKLVGLVDNDSFFSHRGRVIKTSFGDLGLSRNCVVENAKGKYIGFMDADDLVSLNWYYEAFIIARKNENTIFHPECNIYFGQESAIMLHRRQSEYDLRALFFHNLWSSLSFGSRIIYSSCPSAKNEINKGFGYEDWHWNCQTLANGFQHGVVPNTAHGIRIKLANEALSRISQKQNCIIKPTKFWKKCIDDEMVNNNLLPITELSRLLWDDPLIVSYSSFPDWIKETVKTFQNYEPLFLVDENLKNYSPFRKNQYITLLNKNFINKVVDGLDEIHFFRHSASIPAKLFTDILEKRFLCFVDSEFNDSLVNNNIIGLLSLKEILGEKVNSFIASIICQSGCRKIHLWDSVDAESLILNHRLNFEQCIKEIEVHSWLPLRTSNEYLTNFSNDTIHVNFVMENNFQKKEINGDSKKHILFLVNINEKSNPWGQQCVWYRVLGPGQALENNGHRVDYLLLDQIDKIREIITNSKVDFIILHRGSITANFYELRKLTIQFDIPIIYDLDDNILQAGIIKAKHLSHYQKSQKREISNWTALNAKCLSKCTGAIFSTEELLIIGKKYNKNSSLFYNYIPNFYDSISSIVWKKPENTICIFYGPGSLEHSIYLKDVEKGLVSILERGSNTRLILGGGIDVPASLRNFTDKVIKLPKLPPQNYFRVLSLMDIVIAPLITDAFSKCKSWIKALEASAMGIVWVGSPVPSFIRFNKNTGTGIIVKDNNWVKTLNEVYSQLPELKKIAENKKKEITDYYFANSNSELFIETLERINESFKKSLVKRNQSSIFIKKMRKIKKTINKYLIRNLKQIYSRFYNLLKKIIRFILRRLKKTFLYLYNLMKRIIKKLNCTEVIIPSLKVYKTFSDKVFNKTSEESNNLFFGKKELLKQFKFFITKIIGKYYVEDFIRVYPDDIAFNQDGTPRKVSQADKSNYLNHHKFYKFASQFVKGKDVVDVGCGCGHGCETVKKSGAFSVKGTDLSSHSINFAKSKFGQSAEFTIQRATNMNLYADHSFDISLCCEVLEHLKEYNKEDVLLDELKRITKMDGLIIIGTPNSELLGEHGFSYDEIFTLFKNKFSDFLIFENAIEPFGANKQIWHKRLLEGRTGVIVTENINLEETVIITPEKHEIKQGLKPGILMFNGIKIDTSLLHNSHSWVVLAINNM